MSLLLSILIYAFWVDSNQTDFVQVKFAGVHNSYTRFAAAISLSGIPDSIWLAGSSSNIFDGNGVDGKRSFAFLGLPLHMVNGSHDDLKSFLEYVLYQEFGE